LYKIKNDVLHVQAHRVYEKEILIRGTRSYVEKKDENEYTRNDSMRRDFIRVRNLVD